MRGKNPVLSLTDVEYRVILEHRLTRLEVLNWIQTVAISSVIVKYGVLPMLGIVLP